MVSKGAFCGNSSTSGPWSWCTKGQECLRGFLFSASWPQRLCLPMVQIILPMRASVPAGSPAFSTSAPADTVSLPSLFFFFFSFFYNFFPLPLPFHFLTLFFFLFFSYLFLFSLFFLPYLTLPYLFLFFFTTLYPFLFLFYSFFSLFLY